MLYQKSVIYINGDDVLITALNPSTDDKIDFVKKAISLREFVSAIKSSDQSISTKYFCQKTIRYEQTSSRIFLHLFSEPCKVNLKARVDSDGPKEYKDAAFPGYIMRAEFDLNGRFYGSTIRAVKNCFSAFDISESTPTYIMPFPNVYSSSDNICWSSTLSGIPVTLRNANLLLNIFNTSVFNYDLFGPALDKIKNTIPEVTSLDTFFNYLTKVDEFPENLYFESW